MRSDHADPDTLTRVRFDFSLGEELYRAERTPEQERPKVRGEGTTTHLQEATLWRLRRDEAGAAVPDGGAAGDGVEPGDRQSRGHPGLSRGAVPPGRHAAAGTVPAVPRGRLRAARADPAGAVRDRALRGHRARAARRGPGAQALGREDRERRDEVLRRRRRTTPRRSPTAAHAWPWTTRRRASTPNRPARDDAAAQQALAGGREAARRLKERDDAAAEVAALAARDAEVQARRDGARGRPACRRGRRRGATGRRGSGALRRSPRGGRRRRRGGHRG